jgi:hypothetical protein
MSEHRSNIVQDTKSRKKIPEILLEKGEIVPGFFKSVKSAYPKSLKALKSRIGLCAKALANTLM